MAKTNMIKMFISALKPALAQMTGAEIILVIRREITDEADKSDSLSLVSPHGTIRAARDDRLFLDD